LRGRGLRFSVIHAILCLLRIESQKPFRGLSLGAAVQAHLAWILSAIALLGQVPAAALHARSHNNDDEHRFSIAYSEPVVTGQDASLCSDHDHDHEHAGVALKRSKPDDQPEHDHDSDGHCKVCAQFVAAKGYGGTPTPVVCILVHSQVGVLPQRNEASSPQCIALSLKARGPPALTL
jgi:hypothetical protein